MEKSKSLKKKKRRIPVSLISKFRTIFKNRYSGMPTSTGRQALLNIRCRNVADSGRIERVPPRLTPPPGGNNPSLTFSETLSANAGGDDTNKSLSLWLTDSGALPFRGEVSSSLPLLRSGEPSSQRGGSLLPSPRPSNIRRVLRRRRWITGLVVGLRVGLPATEHWVAKSLNFCRVAISELLGHD